MGAQPLAQLAGGGRAFLQLGEHSNPEILRCLKRYIAREVYYILRNQRRNLNQVARAA